MITRGARTGGIARLAAWAAAYALVLQVVLTSALVASLPRDANANILCLNSAIADGGGSSDKGAPLGVHCPACLARVDLASLPAPAPLPVVARSFVPVAFAPLLPGSFRTALVRSPLQPRAPPAKA